MRDGTSWQDWIRPIIARKLDAGCTDDQIMFGILDPKREQVRRLIEAMRAERIAQVA